MKHIDPACAVYVFVVLPLSAVISGALIVGACKLLGWM